MNKGPNEESKHFIIVYSLYTTENLEGKITLTIIKAYNLSNIQDGAKVGL